MDSGIVLSWIGSRTLVDTKICQYSSPLHKRECVCLVTQLCPTLCEPTDCNPPGSFGGDSPGKNPGVGCHAFFRGSSQPRDKTQVSCIAGRFFTIWVTREAQEYWSGWPIPSPGELSGPEIELGSPALQVDSLPGELPGKPCYTMTRTSVLPALNCPWYHGNAGLKMSWEVFPLLTFSLRDCLELTLFIP